MYLQNTVIKIAVIVLTALGSWILAKVKTFINTKVKNEKALELLSAATSAVTSSVKATFQTYVESIKGTDAWTKDTQLNALRMATNTAKAQLSEEVRVYISNNFGDVDAWLENAIEAEIYTLKNSARKTE